jgi:hypothetical protein
MRPGPYCREHRLEHRRAIVDDGDGKRLEVFAERAMLTHPTLTYGFSLSST